MSREENFAALMAHSLIDLLGGGLADEDQAAVFCRFYHVCLCGLECLLIQSSREISNAVPSVN